MAIISAFLLTVTVFDYSISIILIELEMIQSDLIQIIYNTFDPIYSLN